MCDRLKVAELLSYYNRDYLLPMLIFDWNILLSNILSAASVFMLVFSLILTSLLCDFI